MTYYCQYCGTKCRKAKDVYVCPNCGRVAQEVDKEDKEERSYIG